MDYLTSEKLWTKDHSATNGNIEYNVKQIYIYYYH